MGRVLYVDLTRRIAEAREIDRDVQRGYLGGAGLAVRLLYDCMAPGIDPLAPESVLTIAAGPFAGTIVPAGAKFALAGKSPLTGFLGMSLSGSYWAQALRRTGCEAVIVGGRASRPLYLFLDGQAAYFRDARHLLGKGCFETEEAIRAELADPQVRVAAIGPAGEGMVRFASIGNDRSRQLGRGGFGAVWGAKGLKAIALRGQQPLTVADPDEMATTCLELIRRARGPATEAHRTLGTVQELPAMHRRRALPARNFREVGGARADQLVAAHRQATDGIIACSGCPIACEHVVRVKEGRYAGATTSLEYGSLAALGPLCGVDDYAAVVRAAELCDEYGLDAVSTGTAIAWAMQCFEAGILSREDTGGRAISFGDAAAVLALIEAIARRQGLGGILAEGVKRAAAALGQGSERFAVHCRGLELAGYELRMLKPLALRFAVNGRATCQDPLAREDLDGEALIQAIKRQEDEDALLDALGLCRFLRPCLEDLYADTARLYTMATGEPTSATDLTSAARRICDLKRAFDIREGRTRADDALPARLLEEGLPGSVPLDAGEMNDLLTGYYRVRGWTDEGIPDARRLEGLTAASHA